MSFLSFLAEYKWVILFYLLIILFIIVKRKKFVFQSKIIALYKTKIGLKIIDRIGTKYSEFIKILGYVGIGVGYTGMIVILYFIFKGLYDLIFVPHAPATLSLVIPGVPIPGSPVFVPFWYGIIALFVVVLIHEFSHGIVAKAHGLRVLNSGIVFMGPLVGAFVEPDEKKLKKNSDVIQYSVFAAGPFSNILTAVVMMLLLVAIFNPVANAYARPIGFSFEKLETGMPAAKAGLQTGVIYDHVNGAYVNSTEAFVKAFENVKVNDTVIIGNEQNTYYVIPTSKPEKPDKPVIGVNLETRYTNEDNIFMKIFLWLFGLLTWIFILSIGLGLANLLPVGPVDGGRMLGLSLMNTAGEKKGKMIWTKITIFMIILLLFLLLTPIIRAII
jgi:membrane-associated protease RseP (regulator of RpoE activity)